MTRVPAMDRHAERAVLGACLLDAECFAVAADVLAGTEWSSSVHEDIWRAMAALAAAGSPIETLTVRGQLELAGKLTESVDEALLDATNVIPNPDEVEAYASRVRDLAAVRQVGLAAQRVAVEAMEPLEDVPDFLDRSESALTEACNLRTPKSEVVSGEDVVTATFERVLRAKSSGTHVTGHRCDFHVLDWMLSGFNPGNLYLVAGRPGVGKTAFAEQVFLACARNAGPEHGLFFSLEMPKEQLGERMLSSEGKVDLMKLRTGRLNVDESGRLSVAMRSIASLPIFVDDNMDVTVNDIRREARRSVRRHGPLFMIVVDYIQLMKALPGERGRSREQIVSENSRGLKGLARELKCPVVALSQLNRQVEMRGQDARPKLPDLRESGSLEQDADAVLFVYRDEMVNKDSPDQGIAEIIVGKQRQGPTGTVKLAFLKEYTRFENLSRQEPAA